MKSSYLSTVYNPEQRPFTDYPEKLCHYLFQNFLFQKEMKLLEIGCGRGEFLKNFKNLGLNVYGIDIEKAETNHLDNIEVNIVNLNDQKLPYKDNSFDIIFSKSFVEHLSSHENFFNESYRVLKPGGLLLTLTPDWESNYKIFFDDYTHRTPFSIYSLIDIYKIFNFSDVDVFYFRQLPIVWRFPILNYFCAFISPFIPVRTQNKFLKWSRELMLVGQGRKPK